MAIPIAICTKCGNPASIVVQMPQVFDRCLTCDREFDKCLCPPTPLVRIAMALEQIAYELQTNK